LTGQVEKISLLAKGGTRIVLAHPNISQLPNDQVPAKVRITVRSAGDEVKPGDQVKLRAILLPPPEPVAPGAYDFARQAWFDQVGAVGYGVSGMQRLASRIDNQSLADRLLMSISRSQVVISARIRQALEGEKGAVAAALMTGDRGGIPEIVTQNLRDAGLAHLLAISGLHMGLMAALLFFAVRGGFALWENVALRYPIKKWAAAAALIGAFGYLLLTGATVSTQRAFIMTSIVLLAVLVDRSAISMRLVAWAAMIVLLFAPESIWHAGFQMSFAAVVALIATYETLRDRYPYFERKSLRRRIGLYVGGTLLTSLVAGLATAPYAAYHFNRFVDFGLAANLVAVPIMALWIMPWAVAAYGLMVFGLEQLALVPMGWGIDAVLYVAGQVANWPGAVTPVPAFPIAALATFSIGGLWLCLWTRRWRMLGIAPMIFGTVMAFAYRGPDILIDRDAKFFGVRMSGEGLSISGRHQNFAAERWLRRAGKTEFRPWPRQGASQDNWLTCDNLGCLYRPAEGASVALESGVIALVTREAALSEDCLSAEVVISLTPVRRRCPSAHLVIDRFDLWRHGSHAVWLTSEGPSVRTAADARGRRPWTRNRGQKRAKK
jgi:competence protein ComEC